LLRPCQPSFGLCGLSHAQLSALTPAQPLLLAPSLPTAALGAPTALGIWLHFLLSQSGAGRGRHAGPASEKPGTTGTLCLPPYHTFVGQSDNVNNSSFWVPREARSSFHTSEERDQCAWTPPIASRPTCGCDPPWGSRQVRPLVECLFHPVPTLSQTDSHGPET
jgi:hypothetical protein